MRAGNGGERAGFGRRCISLLPGVLAVLLLAWGFSLQPAPSVSAPALSAVWEGAATPDSATPAELAAWLPERSELLERLGVPEWHAQHWRGRGMKVAVLDSGFSGYRSHLGKALPSSVTVRSFRLDGNLEAKDSQHGILCAEVIHALAPEAELLLANWEPEQPEQFLAAVRWAVHEGAHIVSCSIIMPTWSDYEGHGRVHEELTRLLGRGDRPGDTLFFASAGNTAQRHWYGPFQNAGDGAHIWKQAGNVIVTENAISPWGSDRVSVELCCPVRAGYELVVVDATAARPVGRATSKDRGAGGCAVAAFVPESGHDYRVRVRQVRPGPGPFHLVVLGGGLRHSTCQGSISFPGDGAEVIAVGAADAMGRRLGYSSCGLTRGGTKPDLVASVPFPSSWRARPFSGTSAAAPQAAGLAALVWSRHGEWSARRVREALTIAARPCSSSSPTWETGHGLLHLPAASSSLPRRAALTR